MSYILHDTKEDIYLGRNTYGKLCQVDSKLLAIKFLTRAEAERVAFNYWLKDYMKNIRIVRVTE